MFNIIVAHDEENGIGLNNKIPWHNKEDLLFFKKTTIGNGNNAVIMGKNTWYSLPNKPLKDRLNIILSSSLIDKDLNIFKSLDDALNFCKEKNIDDIYIIGGEMLYNEALIHKDLKNVIITKIKGTYECDKFFRIKM